MKNIVKNIRQLFFIDVAWALRFLRKPTSRHYYWSRLIGRKYWDADILGFTLRFMFLTPYQHHVAYQLHRGNLFEPLILAAWKEKARTSRVIYDIGGFNGIYGMLAAKVNPDARVVIFEPDPHNARHIRENIRANNVPNCSIEEVALSNFRGNAAFSAEGKTGSHLSDYGSEVGVDVLDSYPQPDLVKIDVEGAEAQLLAGAPRTLQHKPTMFLEVHGLNHADEVLLWKLINESGYAKTRIGGPEEGNPHYLLS